MGDCGAMRNVFRRFLVRPLKTGSRIPLFRPVHGTAVDSGLHHHFFVFYAAFHIASIPLAKHLVLTLERLCRFFARSANKVSSSIN